MGTYGVTTDSSGNVYVVGMTDGRVQGNGMTGTKEYVVKYSSSGALQWDKVWASGGAGRFGVTVDGSGNVLLGDETYSPSGTLLWQGGVRGNDVSVDSAGNSYVVGLAGAGYPSLSKVDTSGTCLWTSTYSGAGYGMAWYVATDPQGDAVIGGRNSNQLGFAAEFDANGHQLWGTQYSSDVRDVAIDSLGNAYVSSGGRCMKYNTAGVQQWLIDRSYMPAPEIALDPNGALYLYDGYSATEYDSLGNKLDDLTFSISASSFDFAYSNGHIANGGLGNSGNYFTACYTVPEPSSLVLLGIAAAIATALKTRRQRSLSA